MGNRQKGKHVRVEIWLLMITALSLAVRLYHLDQQSLWFDEIFTLVMAQLPFYEGMIGLLGHGIQLTPFFHWIIKIWLFVGDTDWLVRFPSLLVGVLNVPMIFRLGKFYLNRNAGLLAALIFAINPFQVWYAQELKLYTLLSLASIGAMMSFGQLLHSKGKRGWGSLLFFNLIGFPTHYFMFLLSTVQFIYIVLLFKRTYFILRPWLLAQGVAVLPLIPWWIFIIQIERSNVGIGWVPQPGITTLFNTFWNFSFGYTGVFSTASVVSLVVMLIGLSSGVRKAWLDLKHGLLLSLWLFLPPLVTISLSFGRVSFYVDRYLLIVSPILTLLVVYGLLSFKSSFMRTVLFAVFVIATGIGLFNIYFDRTHFSKNDWRSLAHAIEERSHDNDLVITCTDGYLLAYDHYNPHQKIRVDGAVFAPQLYQIGASISGQSVWIIVTHPLPSVHHFANLEPAEFDSSLLSTTAALWEIQNLKEVVTVSGISAYRYSPTNLDTLKEVVAWRCGS